MFSALSHLVPTLLSAAVLAAVPPSPPVIATASSPPGGGESGSLGRAKVGLGQVRASHDGVWPLRPRPEVVHGFDPPSTRWGSGHRGVDLAGHPGHPVLAAKPGAITFAGNLAGRGVVVVDHGDTRTTYEPVRAVVHRGENVAQGQQIGTLQLTGSHCFPRACLHWGLLRGQTYLDPLTLVGAGPVRLLPVDDD